MQWVNRRLPEIEAQVKSPGILIQSMYQYRSTRDDLRCGSGSYQGIINQRASESDTFFRRVHCQAGKEHNPARLVRRTLFRPGERSPGMHLIGYRLFGASASTLEYEVCHADSAALGRRPYQRFLC